MRWNSVFHIDRIEHGFSTESLRLHLKQSKTKQKKTKQKKNVNGAQRRDGYGVQISVIVMSCLLLIEIWAETEPTSTHGATTGPFGCHIFYNSKCIFIASLLFYFFSFPIFFPSVSLFFLNFKLSFSLWLYLWLYLTKK